MKKTALITALVCSASALLWPALTAHAGFEFKSPRGVVSSPSVPPSTAPAEQPAQVMKEELGLALPMPGENLSDLTPVKSTPDTSKAPAADNQVIAGFGKDIPLAIALEQIIPTGYAPAPAENIDMAKTVTWEGGKPWPDVLTTTLAPLDLTATIDGKNVRIEPVKAPQFPTPDAPMANDQDMAVIEPPPVADMQPIDLAPPPEKDDALTDGTVAAPGNLDTAMVDDLSPNQPRRVIATEPTAVTQPAPDIAEPPPPAKTDGADAGIDYIPPMPEAGYKAVPMAAAPPADIGRVDVWTALAGQDLRATLDAWSQRVNVRLVWDSPYMYAVQDTESDARPYSDAVTALLAQYDATGVGPKPQATLYQGNGSDPAVLVIK